MRHRGAFAWRLVQIEVQGTKAWQRRIDQIRGTDNSARKVDMSLRIAVVQHDVLADGWPGRRLRMEIRNAARCGQTQHDPRVPRHPAPPYGRSAARPSG